MDLLERLNAVRDSARIGAVPVQRRDKTLYRVLADCLSICEEVLRDGLEKELRAAIEIGVGGTAGSRFTKSKSDVYTMVCRYAIGRREDYSAVTKYAQTLREASKLQIASSQLTQWLVNNGGARALYLRHKAMNPLNGQMKSTLNLNERVEYPREGPFTIVLRYDGKGFFDVVKGPLRCE